MKNLSEFLVHLLKRGTTLDRTYLSVLRDSCLVCERAISEAPLYLGYRLCPNCRFHYSLTARERIQLLVDRGSFRETNRSISSMHPLVFSNRSAYPRRLSQDQTRTGLTEAVVTGRCTIEDQKVMLVVLDFGFMGGSMGSVVGEKVALTFETAAKSEQPLVALVSGGGVRIQEGVLSLLQMAKTVTAANRLREKQLPFVVVLSNPATGQAYASFANLADVILAEPGSLIGLAPINTLKQASKKPLPLDAHTAEAHLEHGLLDGVVDREDMRSVLGTILGILGSQDGGHSNGKQAAKLAAPEPAEGVDVDEAIHAARHPHRPPASAYIRSMVDNFVEIRGDRVSGDDRTVVGGLGYLSGEPVVIIGQERLQDQAGESYHTYPEGFRKARRLIALAARFRLPVVTLVDTHGAHPGLEAEEQGVGNAVATTLSIMAEVPTPIVSVTIGEGGSEGALALGIGDITLMQGYAIHSPSHPGQNASRLHRGTSRQRQDAPALILTARDCRDLGIIDEVVPEPPGGAHLHPEEATQHLQASIAKHLAALAKLSTKRLVKNRYKKFRNLGESTSHSKAAVRREVSMLQHIVLKDGRGARSRNKREATTQEVVEIEGD